jgi:mono/diheme cytochrome c family protein
MRRFLKWGGITLGVLLIVLLMAVGGMSVAAQARVNKTYDIQPEAVSIPDSAEAIERGRYIYASHCAGCHGDDLAGTPFFDDPALGSIPAPNLTSGEGGAGSRYSDSDFVRAIRHGVDREGKPLAVMPSRAFWHFNDEDLGAIIAYLKRAPPVDKDQGEKEFQLVGRILTTVGALDFLAAEHIDHSAPRPTAVSRGVTAAYGEYLVNTGDCRLCHGEALSGGQPPEPGAPLGPNLTPGGELAGWEAEDFITVMRTGITPSGHQLDGAYMPWEDLGRMTDEDLSAVFLYLQSLPDLELTTE